MDIYTKLDLHIHSFKSGITKSGDKGYVKNSKIDNLDVLVSALEKNDINICAVTDHNIFDKKLYLELKKYENYSTSIKKVLPGIELDLNINGTIVHTICIFNDEEKNHAEKIEENFSVKDNYSLSDLGNMLANIGLDVVLIAHQKTDYKSINQNNTNLSCVGLEYFYRIIDIEYFDSLEVQSSKVEGILKSRFVEDRIENCCLISGSDCHEWSAYPKHDSNSKCTPLLLYMKALPTFRGLVMSLTNPKRFTSENVKRKAFIEEIKYTKSGISNKINLSSGINAIIGDNSVGKSTLIKSLLGIAENGATKFLNSHGILIEKHNLNETDYEFSKQGSIRQKFEANDSKLTLREEFKEYFKHINFDMVSQQIDEIFKNFIRLWEENEVTHKLQTKIGKTLLVSSFDKDNAYYVSFDRKIEKKVVNFQGFTKNINILLNLLLNFIEEYGAKIEKTEYEKINEFYNYLNGLENKYAKLEIKNIFDNKIIDVINSTQNIIDTNLGKKKSSDEKAYGKFKTDYMNIVDLFIKLFIDSNSTKTKPLEKFETISINDVDVLFVDYHFISKMINKINISQSLIENFISDKIQVRDIYSVTSSRVLNKIKGKKFSEKICSNLEELQRLLLEVFSDEYFKSTVEIKRHGENLNEGNSAGTNALYYLDIKSSVYDKPLYIIDQPEDDVSQTKINEILIESFRKFSDKAQIILITHNPQLVVNLDVDNVIIMKKLNNHEIDIISGPLELKTDNIDVLKNVADTLEGGIEVIKKRWKRYEKTNRNENYK